MVEYIQASGLLPRTLAGSPATKWDRSMLEQDWNLPHFGLVKHWQLHHLYSIVLCHGLLLDKPGQKLFSCFTTPIWSIAAETNIWMNDLPDWNFCKLTMFTVCMYLTNIVIYIYHTASTHISFWQIHIQFTAQFWKPLEGSPCHQKQPFPNY